MPRVYEMSSTNTAMTEEEKDEQLLREIESKIKEVTELMANGHTREIVDEHIEDARTLRELHENDTSSVFHITPSGHVPTTRRTQTSLKLAHLLKTRIKLGKYALKLDESLERLSKRYVGVLERILKRSRR